MKFSKFAEKAVLYDKRNAFSKYNGNLDGFPDEMKEFYRENNPIDVEVSNVHFYSAEDLKELQAEYSYLNVQFVFATYNGDPIFLHDNFVYTAPHGVKNPKWELLSEDVEAYLMSLV